MIIISKITSFSLLSYGVGLDLASNGIGAINTLLLCSLLLSLSITLLLITAPLLNVAINNNYKNNAIDLIQEQFRGGGQSIEIDNENSIVSTNIMHISINVSKKFNLLFINL